MRTWSYQAYGLALHSTFPLPGMPTAEDPGGPELSLRLVDEREVVARWRSAHEPPIWQAQLSEGCSFVMERGTDGDYLFRYGEEAWFHLASDGTLRCAPGEPRDRAWLRALLDSVLLSVSLLSGYEALHASAVERTDGVVAFLAGTGGGKTTVAAELVRRGNALFCDDVLALLTSSNGMVWAYPGPPHLNLALDRDSHTCAVDVGETMEVFGEEAWVAVRRAAHQPRPLAAVCLLERRAGLQQTLTALPSNSLTLLPHVLSIGGGPARARARFALYGDLAAMVPIYRLQADVDVTPGELADLVERELPMSHAETPSGAAA